MRILRDRNVRLFLFWNESILVRWLASTRHVAVVWGLVFPLSHLLCLPYLSIVAVGCCELFPSRWLLPTMPPPPTTTRVLPMRAIVCVAGVELPELSLSHGPVGSVLGFDHAPYDKRVRPRWHELLYPYPLRAYKHRYHTTTVRESK